MLSDAALEALFAPYQEARRLVLAVSGGPDSMALMALAARWQQGRGLVQSHRTELVVASVDHGLRAGSADEAALVGKAAASLGLAHQLLHWQGDKPSFRLQERARAARYHLLAELARGLCADAVVTAHHADDQAETILMRLARGSGVAGLAGMRALSIMEGVPLWRPLLGLRKVELAQICAAALLDPIIDPSNANEAFARVRLRKLAAMMAELGLDHVALLRLGARAARADDALNEATERFLTQWVGVFAGGAFCAKARPLLAVPDEIALRALAKVIPRVTANVGFLRLERLERLWETLKRAIASSEPCQRSFAHALIRLDRKGQLFIGAEAPRRNQ